MGNATRQRKVAHMFNRTANTLRLVAVASLAWGFVQVAVFAVARLG